MRPDIARLASQIISGYVDESIPPNDSLVKIAKREKLNENWISRIAEVVNVKLYRDLHEKTGSSMIEYKLANSKEVLRVLKDEEMALRRKNMSLVDNSDTVNQLEKGAAIAAADEVIHYIQKKIEKNSVGLNKVASEGEDMLLTQESQAVKTFVEMFKGAVIGQTEKVERDINSDITEIGDIVMSDTRATGNTSKVLCQVKTAAIEAFPDNKEGMLCIIDMVKEASPHLTSLDPFEGEFEKVSLDKDSRVYELFESVLEKVAEAGDLYKLSEDVKKSKLDFYPKTKKEGRAIVEKIAFMQLGSKLLAGAIKRPLDSLFGMMNLSTIPDEMKEIVGDPLSGSFGAQ